MYFTANDMINDILEGLNIGVLMYKNGIYDAPHNLITITLNDLEIKYNEGNIIFYCAKTRTNWGISVRLFNETSNYKIDYSTSPEKILDLYQRYNKLKSFL